VNSDLERMLIQIAQAPRKEKFFTHADAGLQLHPNVITKRLVQLRDKGFIYEAEGAFHITVNGRKALDQHDVATQRSASPTKRYKTGMGDPGGNYQRPGSDHSHLKSKGVAC